MSHVFLQPGLDLNNQLGLPMYLIYIGVLVISACMNAPFTSSFPTT